MKQSLYFGLLFLFLFFLSCKNKKLDELNAKIDYQEKMIKRQKSKITQLTTDLKNCHTGKCNHQDF
ncbi:hypothetical protein [Empedobacter brevis]|uniref:hypothetical protein n=1 Tax=Empedobacter brevis TaxID=247 RepID=UPI00289903D9|nr:hypothetical protein [Empedobacter brevis]